MPLEKYCSCCGKAQKYKNKDSFRRAKHSVCHSCKNKQNYEDIKEKIEIFVAQGLSVPQISHRLLCSINKINNVIREFRIPYVPKKFKQIKDSEGFVVCTMCGKRGLVRGTRSKCDSCVRKTTIANTGNSIPRFLKKRLWKIKDKCLKNMLEFDLDLDMLLDDYYRQEGRCFYTDQTMTTSLGTGSSRNQLSFDRVDPDKGYTRNNVVLCTFKSNAIKQDISISELKEWMPGWYTRAVRKFAELAV